MREPAEAKYQETLKQQEEAEPQRQAESISGKRFKDLTRESSTTQYQEDDLSSEKGTDYIRLRDLLKKGAWKEADQETYLLMLFAMSKKERKEIKSESILKIPSSDLRTIDRLWVKYSNGKFGFSVQQQIYVECGAKLDGSYPSGEILLSFLDRIAWQKNGKYVLYDQLNFDINAPYGHLPRVASMFTYSWNAFEIGIFSPLVLRLSESQQQELQESSSSSSDQVLRFAESQKQALQENSPFPSDKGDLNSEKDIDYTRLQDLLKAGKWDEADLETSFVMRGYFILIE